jgi:cyanate permease
VILKTNDLKGSVARVGNPFVKVIGDIGKTVKSPGPVLFALSFTMLSFQFMAVMGFLPTLLIQEEHMSKTSAAALSALAVASNVPGNLCGGWLMQRGVKKWGLIMTVCIVAGLCCFGIYNNNLSLVWRYGFCLIFSVVGGVLPAAVMHGAAVSVPRQNLVATSQGLILQGGQLGSLTGPVLIGAVVSQTGQWQSAPWVLIIPSIIGFFMSLKLRRMSI